ncbi:hypothetical protein Ciccas_011045 [Cichlidogyrus casuarinus]|uniref:HTH psq-type domain-containing protein n=1 Tax=Cichlidogyrus casuarinus TaxID=1844966 RepID=A0ABD2PSE2_9PLAT
MPEKGCLQSSALPTRLPTPFELRSAFASPTEYRNLVQKLMRPFQSQDIAESNYNPLAGMILQKLDEVCGSNAMSGLPDQFRRIIQQGVMMRNSMQKQLPLENSVKRQEMFLRAMQSRRGSIEQPVSPVSSTTMSQEKEQQVRQPYTEAELAAAVRAICFGRLGTRRAASVYGIPRSTLRNKICKLNELKRREEERLGGKSISMAEFLQTMVAAETGLHSTVIGGNLQSKSQNAGTYSPGKGSGLSQVASRIASVFQVNCRRSNLVRPTGSIMKDSLNNGKMNPMLSRSKLRFPLNSRMPPSRMMLPLPQRSPELPMASDIPFANPLFLNEFRNQFRCKQNGIDLPEELLKKIPPLMKTMPPQDMKNLPPRPPLNMLSMMHNLSDFLAKSSASAQSKQ